MTWYQLWWQEMASTTAGCRCEFDEGEGTHWTRTDDGTFVHACGLPSIAVLRSQDLLNLFRFGPHHNEVIDTHRLTTDHTVAGWITEYAWTPEKIVGSVSGREARVWVWKDPAAEQ